VATNAYATRILMDGAKATGIEYVQGGKTIQVDADREVILSGGVFNSPQLLMLSGIGPADHLREVGIDPIVDLPGVGRNLQDHLGVLVHYTRPEGGKFRDLMRFDRMAVAMVRAHLFQSGPATVLPGGLHGFVKTRPELSVPNLQFLFRGAPPQAHMWFPGIRRAYTDGFGMRPILLHPESRGEVRLRSSDPRDKPMIVQNFFDSPNDLPVLREGVKIIRDIINRPALDRWRGVEVAPGNGVATDDEIDRWIRNTVVTAHHPSCTCQMGINHDAVLDLELKVRGTEHLRVVDAAAMPDLVSGNIHACVLMIAEKAADMIKGRDPLPAVEGV
jgi:choline dehydrogenase-like flavoprotein